MPLIAMTREMGSLGKDVAAGLAQRKGGRVVYHEIIEPIASKMRLRKSHVERFLDGKAGIWERLTTDKTSLSIFTADETFRFLHDEGTAVIRGWGAVHLLRNVPHVIRVRICAPLELRIRRMMERLGTDNRAVVENEIRLSEEAHGAITRRHFGVNWRDGEHYDLVLSTERLTVDDCVQEVESAMRKPCFQETPESLRVARNLALEWGVRSALRRDPDTADSPIGVKAQDGVVLLTGNVKLFDEMVAARRVAAAVEGVTEVDNQVQAAYTISPRLPQEV